MNWMEVALFDSRAKAEPLRARLTQSGIPAEIHDNLNLHKLWFASKEESGFRLEVPAEMFERAEQLLLDWDAAEAALQDAIRCPECRSLRIEYPQHTEKSMLPNLVMGLLATLGRVKKQYYCFDCHYTWPRVGTNMPEDKANSAPYFFIEDPKGPPPKGKPHIKPA